jgi:hypothetical protein
MTSDNSNSNHFLKSIEIIDKIIDFVKWMWDQEGSESGRINAIFAILLLLATIVVSFRMNEEVYLFFLLMIFSAFLGSCLIVVSNTECEKRKLRLYYELKRKQQ